MFSYTILSQQTEKNKEERLQLFAFSLFLTVNASYKILDNILKW